MTRSFTCLGLTFSVRATDPVLQALVDELYAPFAEDRADGVRFTVLEWALRRGPGFGVYLGSRCLRTTADPAVALAHLVWEINQRAIEASAGAVLLHAAAVEDGDGALLVTGPSGAGKSTLTAALAADGWAYLTDDVAVLDPWAGVVLPYPKPIGLAHRLHRLLPCLTEAPPERARYLGEDGFVTPGALGTTIGRARPPRLVVVARYVPGVPTRLTPLTRGRTLAVLAEQSFNLTRFGPPIVARLGELLRGCRCYRLEFSDLAGAVALLAEAAAKDTAVLR